MIKTATAPGKQIKTRRRLSSTEYSFQGRENTVKNRSIILFETSITDIIIIAQITQKREINMNILTQNRRMLVDLGKYGTICENGEGTIYKVASTETYDNGRVKYYDPEVILGVYSKERAVEVMRILAEAYGKTECFIMPEE